jgi:hypothetical protein
MWKRWWAAKPVAKPTGTTEESGGTFSGSSREKESGFTQEDEDLLDRIVSAVMRWKMSAPAIFMLESSKPMNFVGSQFLHFLSPIVHSVFDAREMDRFAVLLERRDTIEKLIRRIEAAEAAPR